MKSISCTLFTFFFTLIVSAQTPALLVNTAYRGELSKSANPFAALPHAVSSFAEDDSGNVYQVFDTRTDTAFLNGSALNNASSGIDFIHLLKYNASNQVAWHKVFIKGNSVASVPKITVSNSEIYLYGTYSGRTIDFGNGVFLDTFLSNHNSFVAVLDLNGTAKKAVRLEGWITDIQPYNGNILFLLNKYSNDSLNEIGDSVINSAKNRSYETFLGELKFTGKLEWVRILPEYYENLLLSGNSLYIHQASNLRLNSTDQTLDFNGLQLANDFYSSRKTLSLLKFDIPARSFTHTFTVPRSNAVILPEAIDTDPQKNLYFITYFKDSLHLPGQTLVESFDSKWILIKLDSNFNLVWKKLATSAMNPAYSSRSLKYFHDDSIMVTLENPMFPFVMAGMNEQINSDYTNGQPAIRILARFDETGAGHNAWPVYGFRPHRLLIKRNYKVVAVSRIPDNGVTLLGTSYPPSAPSGRYQSPGWLLTFHSIGNITSDKKIKSKQSSQSFVIFPNPASTEITLKLPFPIQQPFELQIYDLFSGREMLNTQSSSFNVNVKDLPPSVYLVHVKSYNKIYYSKLIISR